MPKPPTLTVKKLIALTPAMAKAIKDYRFAHRIGSETEAIRQLIMHGLQADGEGTPGVADQPKQIRTNTRRKQRSGQSK